VFHHTCHQPRAFFERIQLLFTHPANHKGIVARQVVVSLSDGLHRLHPPVDITLYRMHAAFAVVGRTHGHALGDELLTQFYIINHVAIMCAHQVAIRIQVRLRIHLRRRTKGCPAQLQNAPAAEHISKAQPVGHFNHLADIFTQINGAILVHRGASHRIVSPIRKPQSCINQDRAKLLFTVCDDAENSAHAFYLPIIDFLLKRG